MSAWMTYDELVKMGPWSRRQWQRLVNGKIIKARRVGHRTVRICRRSVEIYLAISAS